MFIKCHYLHFNQTELILCYIDRVLKKKSNCFYGTQGADHTTPEGDILCTVSGIWWGFISFSICFYVLTGLSGFVHVGGWELITDWGLLRTNHGHQLLARAQHEGFLGPLGRHEWCTSQSHLLEATIPLPLCLHLCHRLVKGWSQRVRGQGMRGVWGSGPLGLGGLVE